LKGLFTFIYPKTYGCLLIINKLFFEQENIVKKQNIRHIKKRLHEILNSSNWESLLHEVYSYPLRQVINPLISFLCSTDKEIKQRAIITIGRVVRSIADKNMESARIIMRRLMWSLNDESGGIGWGAPEAMAEIMSLHEQMAVEYASILISYADPDGNYLEHVELQKEVLKGLARLAKVRPLLIKDAIPSLKKNNLCENENIVMLRKNILEILSRTMCQT
jgi:hypothetical protein